MRASTNRSDVCAVADCNRPRRLSDYCGAHHQRLLRKGDVQAHIPLRGQPIAQGWLWCGGCQRSRPEADFGRSARNTARNQKEDRCRDCQQRRRGERSVQLALNGKRKRERHAEKIKARKREAYRRDPTKHSEANRRWRAANPDKMRQQIRAQNAARYARDKGALGHATPAQLAARWAYYGHRCWMCGADATDTDHVKPLAVGGSNWPANLRPSCRRCNRSKSGKWPYSVQVSDTRPMAFERAV